MVIYKNSESNYLTSKKVYIYKGKGHPATGRSVSRGSGKVKAPDFLDVQHYKGGRSSA